ncbi:MAG: hypothetical protein ABJA76_06830 [Mucilaginibacter sp.]
MKKLTREELKNVKGGYDPLPSGCFCFIPVAMLPAGGLDIDCNLYQNPELYCPADQLVGCC